MISHDKFKDHLYSFVEIGLALAQWDGEPMWSVGLSGSNMATFILAHQLCMSVRDTKEHKT
jgi:hypothetical protein